MGKKRTRKQKQQARHPFLITWEKTEQMSSSSGLVKRQFENKAKQAIAKTNQPKRANILDKDSNLSSIKHDIIKSLLLTSLILSLEIMLYLAW